MIKTTQDEALLKTTHTTYLISEFLKERQKVLGTVASWMNPFWVISPDAFKEDIIENIDKFLRKYPGIDSIHFLNRQGVIAWGVPPQRSLEGVNLFQDILQPKRYITLVQTAREKKTTLLAPLSITEFNPRTGKLARTEMLLIVAPVIRNNTYLGSLLALLRIDTIGRHFFPSSRGEHFGFWAMTGKKGRFFFINAPTKEISECMQKFSREINTAKPFRSIILNCGQKGKPGRSFLVSWSTLPIGNSNKWRIIRAFPLSRIETETHFWLWEIRGIASVVIAIMVLTAIFLLVSFQNSENRLDALNRKYRDLLDNLMVGTFTFNAATGKIDYINQRACEILGYKPEELIGRDRLSFASEREKDEIARISGQRMRGERQAESYRSHMVHRSGKVIDVEIFASPVRGENGEIQSVRVMFTDITRQLEMEREIQRYTQHLEELVQNRTHALRESEALYRSIFETSLAIIYIHQDDRFKVMNKAGMEFFGFDTWDEMLHTNVWDTVPEGEREKRRINALRRMAGDPIPSRYESLVINKDGEVKVMECNFQRIIYQDEIAILAILFDVSEKKKLEVEMAHADRLKSMGQLATGVAHDFNNILSAILGRIQLLKQKPNDLKMVLSCAQLIEQAVDQGIHAIRRIQEITRVRQDRMTALSLPLNRLIDDAIEITRYAWKDQAQKNGITIRIKKELQARDSLFPSDLREVFMNLILNAVDAMPKGGILSIRTQPEPFDQGEEGIKIVFEDTGIGIPKNILKHVTEPFYTTKGTLGTGLGLSIVTKEITNLGGTFNIESQEGKGTRVILRIPLPKDAHETEPISLKPASAEGPKKKGALLVVDDEPALTGIFRDLFASRDIEVVTANSAEEALKIFTGNAEAFALIFTDLGMPGMNGWDLVKKIRGMDRDIPIVLMTGWGLEISEEERVKAEVTEIISKPLTLQTILETASRFVQI